MNIKSMVNRLLIQYSNKNKVFYMETRTYKDGKVYKKYTITIYDEDRYKEKHEFKTELELIKYLSKELM